MFIHISNNIHFISKYNMNSCIDFEIPPFHVLNGIFLAVKCLELRMLNFWNGRL